MAGSAGRRPEARPDLGGLRRLQAAGRDPHRRSRRFFTPLDRFSERWHELNEHPEWLFHGKDFPRRSDLHAQRSG